MTSAGLRFLLFSQQQACSGPFQIWNAAVSKLPHPGRCYRDTAPRSPAQPSPGLSILLTEPLRGKRKLFAVRPWASGWISGTSQQIGKAGMCLSEPLRWDRQGAAYRTCR